MIRLVVDLDLIGYENMGLVDQVEQIQGFNNA